MSLVFLCPQGVCSNQDQGTVHRVSEAPVECRAPSPLCCWAHLTPRAGLSGAWLSLACHGLPGVRLQCLWPRAELLAPVRLPALSKACPPSLDSGVLL